MLLPLSIPDNMHALLRMLYDDMMPLCGHMTRIASAIAGLGALLYISYRVWQSMARGEAIDLFPLLRPFALGLCIMLFQPLVLGGLNGILSPVVTGAHQLLTDRTLDMRRYQRQKDDLERESLARNPSTAYYVSDEEFDRQIGELGWSPEDLNAMENMYEERVSFSLRSLCVSAFRWLLEQLFEIASVIVDIIRTFYLIVLSFLGPLVFAVSVFDGFRDSLVHWFAKYVSVYLWLPVADIFGAVLARIQTLSLQQDMDRMLVDPFYFVDSNNSIYILFMVVGIIGYFTIPSVAGWVVQASGFGAYNRKLNAAGMKAKNLVTGTAGYAWGKTAHLWKSMTAKPPSAASRKS